MSSAAFLETIWALSACRHSTCLIKTQVFQEISTELLLQTFKTTGLANTSCYRSTCASRSSREGYSVHRDSVIQMVVICVTGTEMVEVATDPPAVEAIAVVDLAEEEGI